MHRISIVVAVGLAGVVLVLAVGRPDKGKPAAVVVPAEYKNLFPATEKGKPVLINDKGEVVHRGETPREFPCDRGAMAGPDGKVGYIDSTGQWMIEPIYGSGSSFSDGVAWVNEGNLLTFSRTLIDTQGQKLFSLSTLHRFDDGRAPVHLNVRDFADGLAARAVLIESDKPLDFPTRWGFIDKTGKLAIDAQFDMTGDFRNGTAWVRFPDGRSGVIDKTGKLLSPPDIRCLSNVSEGLIAAETKEGAGGAGFIDITGKWVIAPRFKIVDEFHEGLAPAAVAVGAGAAATLKFGYIDKTGKFVIEPTFNGGARQFSEGRAAVAVIDPQGLPRWGYIKRDGTFIYEPKLGYAQPFDRGLAQCWEDATKNMYINAEGKVVWTDTGPYR